MRRVPARKVQLILELLCKLPDKKPTPKPTPKPTYPQGHVGNINYNPVPKYPYGQK